MTALNALKVKIFADGAEKAGMLDLYRRPHIKGFTTNPTLMRKAGVTDYKAFALDVLKAIPDRPVSFEVFADDFGQMESQAREIASWGRASLIVPIPEKVSQDQRENAYAYARTGATEVIEQNNLTPHLLLAEIERLFTNPKARNDMAEAAKKFSKPNAAKVLAQAVLDAALAHED